MCILHHENWKSMWKTFCFCGDKAIEAEAKSSETLSD